MGEALQDDADEVWNRACDALADGLPPDARVGDVMLLHAIAFDGWVHNGGLLNRVEVEDEESLDPALEALRWFGLVDVAELVEQVRDRWRRLAAEGAPRGAAEQLENGRHATPNDRAGARSSAHRLAPISPTLAAEPERRAARPPDP